MARCELSKAEVGIFSFGDKVVAKGRPTSCYIFNVSGLRDPMSSGGFRKKYENGLAFEVLKYVEEDPRMAGIITNIKLLTHIHLRSDARDGKWLSFGIMDHHGRWTSPAVAEIAGNALGREGYAVNVYHYDLLKGDIL